MKPFIASIASCFLVLVSVLPTYAQKVPPTSAGKSQVVNRDTKDGFAIGDIRLAWDIDGLKGIDKGSDRKNCVVIYIRKFRSQGGKYIPDGLKFAIVEKGEISDIEDPSALNYQNEIPAKRGFGEWRYVHVPKTVFDPAQGKKSGEPVKGISPVDAEKYTVTAGILINYNEILFLQLGNKYAAIKPTNTATYYLPWEQTANRDKAMLAETLQGRIKQAKPGWEIQVPRMAGPRTMDCDWAYWKFIPSRPPISKELIVKSASQSQAK